MHDDEQRRTLERFVAERGDRLLPTARWPATCHAKALQEAVAGRRCRAQREQRLNTLYTEVARRKRG